MKTRIKDLAVQYAPESIAIRHHIHSHPELSFQEHETSAFIQRKLDEYGIPYTAGVAGTGIVALIKGNHPDSRVVAIRADIDALPITEANEVPYKSQHAGVMHACGHDVHTTCVLGAARILQELKAEWEGTVKVIFQPGEEKHPGGASLMIQEGVLDNPRPEKILGLHVQPNMETGLVGFRAGQYMASADEIYITIRGKGGHAAAPHLTVDTILVASHLVVSLQQIISRNNNPFTPSVLSICAFNGGYTTNVIPSEVKLMGTFRAMDETWRFKAHALIKKQATELVHAMGADIDIEILVGYPCLYNNETVTAEARSLATEYMGEAHVVDTEVRMGAEDFAFYSQIIPACFFRLGTGNVEKGITSGVHTPTFDVDEGAIAHGIGTMAYLAMHI
ncbi:amidohydrolase [Chitinophaga pendula]|uniref:M20 metallopeptidase family protein n=1 Tax=Chitinophaga TaxID=79328 RepID=UPI000BB02BE3|nr:MULTISPECIES: M20 family metallopeptidase [Chitinophaga]ASZ09791.1 N-acyl-L-amino acid amidohydrolase [Chitinophaga sp. MD30]UCJ07269.1 amidohydrolase [Chitinophaga pendula]